MHGYWVHNTDTIVLLSLRLLCEGVYVDALTRCFFVQLSTLIDITTRATIYSSSKLFLFLPFLQPFFSLIHNALLGFCLKKTDWLYESVWNILIRKWLRFFIFNRFGYFLSIHRFCFAATMYRSVLKRSSFPDRNVMHIECTKFEIVL